VRGQVQGVGFRPFVWQLARAHGVTGQVLNDPEGVLIHAHGASPAFLDDLREKAPPLSRIDAIETAPHAFDAPPTSFLIAASEGVGARTRVTPDAATCPDCLAEIRDPADRRFGYAFANCTHCGPRLSILDRLPYDRAQTSMAAFAMCDACRAEYEDPGDRRFHAQPVACAACGPRVWLERDGANRPATRWVRRPFFCKKAASSPSRGSAVSTWPAMPRTRGPSPRCARARGGRPSRSRSWRRSISSCATPRRRRRNSIFYKVPPPPSFFWRNTGRPCPTSSPPGRRRSAGCCPTRRSITFCSTVSDPAGDDLRQSLG
jgi:acylphosphatase